MQLFYDPQIVPPEHTLAEEESHHCVRVLRLGAGDMVHVTDGRGNIYRCRITEPDRRRCRIEVVETQSGAGRLPYGLTMAVAPTKNTERFDWFLEKATEVGIDEIIPLESEHSERRTLKNERAMKVIVAAVKQSLKAYCPLLRQMTPFGRLIAEPFDGIKLIAHCDETHPVPRRPLRSAVKPAERVLILTGPEGDFSRAEIDAAVEAGFVPVTLGERRLRTETAAVAAVVTVAMLNEPEDE